MTVCERSKIVDPRQLYPAGRHLKINIPELKLFIQYFRFLTVDNLLALANAHNIKFASSSWTIAKVSLQKHLLLHQCDNQCNKLPYVFKMLNDDRRETRCQPLLDVEQTIHDRRLSKTQDRKKERNRMDDNMLENICSTDREQH